MSDCYNSDVISQGPAVDLRSLTDWNWRYSPGSRNAITDVPGIRIGHDDLRDPNRGLCTGVTVVDIDRDLVAEPLPAAVHVINGYGKTTGLMQIAELGELESPIVLTGVFDVPSVSAALLRRLLAQYPEIGDEERGRSINTVVMECNDSYLHDPRAAVPSDAELTAAFDAATDGTFARGTVGAGVGMSTFGFAGGVGTASRRVGVGIIGTILLTNFGSRGDLLMAGRPIGRLLSARDGSDSLRPGSVITVIATDLPLGAFELRRLAHRAQNGLARTGCPTAHGSGEVVLAFSTARGPRAPVATDLLDDAFRAVAECVEESVLDSLVSSHTSYGRAGRIREPLPTADLAALLS